MNTFSLQHEPQIRLVCFLAVLLAMMAWEGLAPRRKLSVGRARWVGNLGLIVLGSAALRLLPLLAIGAAAVARERGWGLFNHATLPRALVVGLSVLALDLLIYAQHVVFHHVPAFWRLHQVHHADPDFDVTTALRFHPLEIVLSMGLKMAAVVALGAPPVAVLLFEVLLNATAMFSHGNVKLAPALDALARRCLVTPDMHRVHHSWLRREHDSNFGFNLSVWDRLFGTYRAQPERGHEGMRIGLERWGAGTEATALRWLLLMPFRPLGRR